MLVRLSGVFRALSASKIFSNPQYFPFITVSHQQYSQVKKIHTNQYHGGHPNDFLFEGLCQENFYRRNNYYPGGLSYY